MLDKITLFFDCPLITINKLIVSNFGITRPPPYEKFENSILKNYILLTRLILSI